MVKALSFFKRRAGMPVDEFQVYWLARHPDVVTKLAGVRRYVQSHTHADAYRGGEPVYDGIAEVWFQKHWREVHGPLGAVVPGLRRYVQSHTRLSAYNRGRDPIWDGVALIWFDDPAAMRAAMTTPQWSRVTADEVNFVEPGSGRFIVTTEHVIVG